MTMTDEAELRQALLGIRDDLALRYEHGPRLLSQHNAPVKTNRRNGWFFGVGAVVVALGVGGTAAAISLSQDHTYDEFTSLHPGKSQASSQTEEPHVLVGTIATGDHGIVAKVYVTSKPGTDDCVLVEHYSASGADQDGLGACGTNPAGTAQARVVYDVVVGRLPIKGASQVIVAFDGHRYRASVVRQHFAQPTRQSNVTGNTETVTAIDAAGHELGAWTITVN